MAKIPPKIPKNQNDLQAGTIFIDTDRNSPLIYIDGMLRAGNLPEGWVNVKDFGAKGDGVTDDTEAFLNAINTGLNVYVPNGNYIISSTLTLQTGQTISGISLPPVYSSWTIPSTPKTSRLIFTGAEGNFIVMNGYATIENLFIQSNATHSHDVISIDPTTTQFAQTAYGIRLLNLVIQGNTISNNWNDVENLTNAIVGIHFKNSEQNRYLYFSKINNIHIIKVDAGIYMDHEANGGTFTGITIIDARGYIIMKHSLENTIVGNYFRMQPQIPESYVFTLKNGSVNNTFIYNTECKGTAFNVDDTSKGNIFMGTTNELYPSSPGKNNIYSNFIDSKLLSLKHEILYSNENAPSSMYLTRTTYSKKITGIKANNNTGDLIENDPSSAILLELNLNRNYIIDLVLHVVGPYAKEPTYWKGTIFITNTDTTNFKQYAITSTNIATHGTNTITGIHVAFDQSNSKFYIVGTFGNYGNYFTHAVLVHANILSHAYQVAPFNAYLVNEPSISSVSSSMSTYYVNCITPISNAPLTIP